MIKKVQLEKAVEIFVNKVQKDFLPDEIPPLHVFERCIKEDTLEWFVYEHEGKEVGYIVGRKKDDLVFLLVLAINEEMRGKSLGKTMLEEFKNSVKERKIILLEAENPDATDDEQEKLARNKRISFYERLGFKVTENLKYLLVNIDYKILYYCLDDEEKIIDTDEVINCMRKVYDGILRNQAMLVMENLSKK